MAHDPSQELFGSDRRHLLVDKLVLLNDFSGVILDKKNLRIIELLSRGKGEKLELTHANKIDDTKFFSHKSVLFISH